MSVYNSEMVEVLGLLEDIILDEFTVTRLSDNGSLTHVYRHFLERLKYEYRWFGIRSKNEFIDKWNDVRSEFVIEDSSFKDTQPSVQTTLLTNITQRMLLVTEDSIWEGDEGLCQRIASVIHVYSVGHDNTKSGEDIMYDAQIATTVSKQDIADILDMNTWLVVVILISWISNRCVLQALGHLTYDN